MGNFNNKIHKKICLEHFKSRVPGVISSIKESENDVNRGNWNEIPFDLKLNELSGLEGLKKYMSDQHYNAKKVECEVDNEGNRTTVSDLPEEPRLRYRNLMLWYYWVIKLCKNSEIYESTKNNADVSNRNSLWVLKDDYDVFNSDVRNKTRLVFEYDKEEFPNGDKIEVKEWDRNNIYMIVSRNDKEFFDNHSGFELVSLVEDIIGRLYVPDTITGCEVPKFIYFSEIQDSFDYLDKIKNSEDCCEKEEYEKMGGDSMYHFLEGYMNTFENKVEEQKHHNLIPYVDIPIALTCDIEDLGVMFNAEQEWIAGNKYEIGDIVTYDGSTYIATKDNTGVYNEKYDEVYFDSLNSKNEIVLTNWREYVDLSEFNINKTIEGEAVSQLKSFKTKRKTYTDNGVELEGVLPYREGTTNLVKDANGYVILEPQYISGIPYSVVVNENGQRYGDVLLGWEDDGNKIIRFNYVMGAELNNNNPITNTGIKYTEAYIYSWEETRDEVDGQKVKIKYRKINYSLNVDNGSVFPILSKITYRSQDIWNNNTAITVPTFRKDYMIGMSEYPHEDVNIVIDRGLSHAFEKHLMLTETNTFNDLKNYKNNYFNLQ